MKQVGIFSIPENLEKLKVNFMRCNKEELTNMFGVQYDTIRKTARNIFGYSKKVGAKKCIDMDGYDPETYEHPFLKQKVFTGDVYAYRLGYPIDKEMW